MGGSGLVLSCSYKRVVIISYIESGANEQD